MLHKNSFRTRGQLEGSRSKIVVRKRHGWSNLEALVGVRNFLIQEEKNKESGIPFQTNFNGDDSKLGIVIERYQLSGNSGSKQHSPTWASNPTGKGG